MEVTEDVKNVLLDRLLYELVKAECPNIEQVKARYVILLDRYDIRPKEKAVVVWTEGKNENALKRFLLAKAVAGCSKRTIEFYMKNMQIFFRATPKDFDTVTSADIQIFLARTIQRSSKVNADNFRRTLSSFYAWLVREELILKNPMNKVDKIKMDKKEKKAFTDLDIEKIRTACETNRDRAIIEILLSTGCRISELANMKMSDIKEDSVGIIGKGNKFRKVYLNAKAQLALAQYLQERKDSNPYLFPKGIPFMDPIWNTLRAEGPKRMKSFYKYPELIGKGRMDTSSIGEIVRNIGKRAGVEKTHPHRFRRTCATMALHRGMPIEQVSKMLGHESLETTQIYLDLSEEDLAAAHRKFVV